MHTARKAKREARDLARFARAGPNGAEAGSWARAIQIWGKDENPIEWREDSDDDNDWFPEGDDDDGNDDFEPPPPPPPTGGHGIAAGG